MNCRFRVLAACLIFSLGLFADEGHHHDASEKLGAVSFPTSCAPAVQKPFERGVALLHSFEISLHTDPNRFNGLYGAAQAAELAQQKQKAAGYYAQLIANCQGAHSDRPELEKAKMLVAAK